jgi:Ca2+-binding EF-hand superfamily protein
MVKFSTDADKKLKYKIFASVAKEWTKTGPDALARARGDGENAGDGKSERDKEIRSLNAKNKAFSDSFSDELLQQKVREQKLAFQRVEAIRSKLQSMIESREWRGIDEDEMKKMFRKIDRDALDTVNSAEFRVMLAQDLEFPLHANELSALANYYRVSEGSDDVDYKAFTKFAESLLIRKVDDKKTEEQYDREEEGIRVAKKLTELVREGKWSGISKNSMKDAFEHFDADDGGYLHKDDFQDGLKKLCLPVTDDESATLLGLFEIKGRINYKDFVNFSVPWTFADYSDSASISMARELTRLREENLALRQELSIFDMEFFDDVEDLKYEYSQATLRNRSLQIHVMDLCDRAGIDPALLGINAKLDGPYSMWKPSNTLNSGVKTVGRRSVSSVLTSGDILKRAFSMIEGDPIKQLKRIEEAFLDIDFRNSGVVTGIDLEIILKKSSLLLSDREIKVIVKSLCNDKAKLPHDDEASDDSDVGMEPEVRYHEFLKALKSIVNSVGGKKYDEVEESILKGYTGSSLSRSKAQADKEKRREEELMSITKHLNREYKKGNWDGVSRRKMLKEFREADIDDTGSISGGEFRSILKDFEIPLHSDMIKTLLHEFKTTHGEFIYREFIDFLEKWDTDSGKEERDDRR